MKIRKYREHKYPKVERKYGDILGVKVSITKRDEVLNFIKSRLESKEKFYIVSMNPENLLLATKDWLLHKVIRRSDLSIADGIGLAQAYKFLKLDEHKGNLLKPIIIFGQGMLVGLATFFNKKYLTDVLPIIKGRELFLDMIEIANERGLKVYLFGGEHEEAQKAKLELEKVYKNVTFKTNFQFPQYNRNCKPINLENRKLHKSIIGGIKLFEPDFVFVAMNTPKQEKWIYRNFFRLPKVVGAMAVGGTFNYLARNMKLPPKWMDKIGLEWVWRLICEPVRLKRILNAFPIFPWKVFLWKLNPPIKIRKKV